VGILAARSPVPTDVHQARAEFVCDGGGVGRRGNAELYADGNKTQMFSFPMDETLDAGVDTDEVVSGAIPCRIGAAVATRATGLGSLWE
jgi:hypothetical protein